MPYGLDRDFSARFNAPTYHPFTAYKLKEVSPSEEQLAAESLAKQEHKRAMWRAAWKRSREAARAAATRVNLESTLGCASGMAKQVQEIRAEMRKTKATSAGN